VKIEMDLNLVKADERGELSLRLILHGGPSARPASAPTPACSRTSALGLRRDGDQVCFGRS
jgi:hypothetical protein